MNSQLIGIVAHCEKNKNFPNIIASFDEKKGKKFSAFFPLPPSLSQVNEQNVAKVAFKEHHPPPPPQLQYSMYALG